MSGRQAMPAGLAGAPEPPAGLTATVPAAATAPATLRCAVHAEWVKFRTAPGMAWLLAGIVVVTVAIGAAAASASHCPAGQSCPVNTAKLSLLGVQFGQALVAVLAVLTVCGEYSTGMIRTTLAAVPCRTAVLAAKALIVAGLVLLAAAFAVGGSVWAGRLILPGHGFTAARGFVPLSLAYGPALRACAGSVIYLVLVALLTIGLATIIRESAAAIGVALGLLYVLPIVASFLSNSPAWQDRVDRYSPTAGLNIQATTGLHSLHITPWGGLGVLALWALAALLGGGAALLVRDA